MKRTLQIFAIALAVGSSSLSVHAADNKMPTRYDGKWWSLTEPEERSGFLNGAADCLAWVAHEKWVSHSIEWAVPRITEYYKTHAADAGLPVLDVWRKVLSEAPPETPSKGGEVHTNPHGFYDGLYWRQSSEAERKGFLEGYFWCLRTRVKSPSETYSLSVGYYVREINDYVQKYPKSDDEAIAVILSKFRDKRNVRVPTKDSGGWRR